MYTNETQIRVRYCETDRMGYLHHGHYIDYFEAGRTELLRSLGLTYREMEDNGIILPVINIDVHYMSPAHYDELLTVKTTLKEKPLVKLILGYEIYNDQGTLLCTGNSTLVFTNASTRKPCRTPDYFLEKINQFFE